MHTHSAGCLVIYSAVWQSVAGRGESEYKERARSPFQTLTPGHGASSKGGYHHAKAGFCRVHRVDTSPAAGRQG